jgi:hypothetical protein
MQSSKSNISPSDDNQLSSGFELGTSWFRAGNGTRRPKWPLHPLVEEKAWIKHQLYTNPLSRHLAVLLPQVCHRSLEIRVRSCGTSEDLDRQAMLKEIWESNVSKLYIEEEGSLTLSSDK